MCVLYSLSLSLAVGERGTECERGGLGEETALSTEARLQGEPGEKPIQKAAPVRPQRGEEVVQGEPSKCLWLLSPSLPCPFSERS